MAQDKNRRQVIKNIGLGAGALGMASISKVFAANASEEKFQKKQFPEKSTTRFAAGAMEIFRWKPSRKPVKKWASRPSTF